MPARTTASRLSPMLSVYAPNRVLASSRPHQIVMTAVISTGTGIHPPRLVVAEGGDRGRDGRDLLAVVEQVAEPVAMPSVPSVTTNGGIAGPGHQEPVDQRRTPAPTASAASEAERRPGRPRPRAGAAANQCAITQAPAVPAQPSTAPTDRSMPPAQMTNVSPTASSSTSVRVLEVFSQLARVRKYGESRLNATTAPAAPRRSTGRGRRPGCGSHSARLQRRRLCPGPAPMCARPGHHRPRLRASWPR